MKPEDQGIETGHERGAWMSTSRGGRFYPLDPKPEEVYIEDIAHALSMQARFNGHLREFYSVAQHSYLCSVHVDSSDARVALTALLHDAPEAYIGDMIRPVKVYDTWFKYIDQRIWEVIAERFNIPRVMPAEVHEIDGAMCAAEKRDMHNSTELWANMPSCDHLPGIVPLSPAMAKAQFLARYEELVSQLERAAA